MNCNFILVSAATACLILLTHVQETYADRPCQRDGGRCTKNCPKPHPILRWPYGYDCTSDEFCCEVLLVWADNGWKQIFPWDTLADPTLHSRLSKQANENEEGRKGNKPLARQNSRNGSNKRQNSVNGKPEKLLNPSGFQRSNGNAVVGSGSFRRQSSNNVNKPLARQNSGNGSFRKQNNNKPVVNPQPPKISPNIAAKPSNYTPNGRKRKRCWFL